MTTPKTTEATASEPKSTTTERARPDAFHGLHVLADDDPRWNRDPVSQAELACEGGASVVQLRSKHATDAETLEWAHAIRRVTQDHAVRFVVNDRIDLALLSGADGVHLGQDDLPPNAIPKALRARLAVGRSTHTPAQLEATRHEDVDYVAFGPVFGTTSKDSPYAARGEEALGQAVELAAPRPLVAIGGIGLGELALLRAAGAAGFAVISVVAGAKDPVAATRDLVNTFAGVPK